MSTAREARPAFGCAPAAALRKCAPGKTFGAPRSARSRRAPRRTRMTASAGGGGGSGGTKGGGGGQGGGGGGGEGGAGRGNDDSNEPLASPQELRALLRENGKSMNQLTPDLVLAVSNGLISVDRLRAYLKFEAGWCGWLIRWSKPFRDRFLCDSQFVFKLLAQELIGNGTQLVGELIERGRAVGDELEYVFSDLFIGTVIEAAFVWLLAPRVPFPSLQRASSSAIGSFLAGLPASFFEANSAQRSYSLAQRFFSVGYVSAQYMALGFAGGIVGTIVAYALIRGRQALQPSYRPKRSLPPVIPNSLGWGLFMATSSNLRFQLVDGIELATARALAAQQRLLHAVIIALRLANNLYGGVQFVQMFRLLGLQSTGEH